MRRTLALALLAAVPLLNPACADEAGPATLATVDDPVALLHRAPDAARGTGSSRFELVMDLTLPELGNASMTMAGASDLDAGMLEVRMDLSAIFAAISGQTGEAPPFEPTTEMILTPDVFYLRGSMFGDTWLTGDVEEITGGVTGDQLFAQAMSDPMAYLDFLRAVGRDPEVLGDEEVRGVATTHYATELTLADAVESAPGAQRAAIESMLDQVPADVRDTPMAVDAWIDADGLPRRIRIDLTQLMGGSVPGGGAEVVMELFDYGEPVEIDVPDPAETKPFSEALGGTFGR